MVSDSSENCGDLPFKEPEQPPALVDADAQVLKTAEGSAAIEPMESGGLDERALSSTEPEQTSLSVSHLLTQLSLSFDSLKQLNFGGFKEVYPVFLIVFGAVVLGLLLSFVSSFLHSVNQLPLVGGLLQGISELVGMVALVRFVTANLLLQHRRAELFARIAVLKKDLMGDPK